MRSKWNFRKCVIVHLHLALGEAPCCKSNCMQSVRLGWEHCAALCKAVSSHVFRAATLHPLDNRYCMHVRWPSSAASINGVSPLPFLASFTSWSCRQYCRSVTRQEKWPSLAHTCTAVLLDFLPLVTAPATGRSASLRTARGLSFERIKPSLWELPSTNSPSRSADRPRWPPLSWLSPAPIVFAGLKIYLATGMPLHSTATPFARCEGRGKWA